MAEHTELLTRYRHLRQVGRELNNRLLATLPREAFNEGGNRLGILKKNVLVFDNEHEMAVLMDYCLYDMRQHGENAIERFLATSPPPPDSDEMLVLQGMRHAYYSLFAVEATEPGVGVYVRDLLREESQFLVDVSLSQTALVGGVLASRVTVQDGIAMTTGAGLPVGKLDEAAQAGFQQAIMTLFPGTDFRNPSPEQASAFATVIIRKCLQEGASAFIRDEEPLPRMRPGPKPAALASGRRNRGDRPCPCGSGKKYKNCCGARR